jgi:L-glutamine:2-deoxy-scyllo-inosose/3-amino-2,3-dideoxy-scyllo-inosose aminotransferase
LTWQATASAVLDVNAVPILVDIDPETYTIDPRKIEEAVTIRTKCIIPVHLYGRMADMDAIISIANKYKLHVIEDTSHQHGSIWKDKPAGSIGDIGTFSLQSSKILNSGEGGLIITQNKRYYELLMSLVSCGRKLSDESPTMQSGNYRLTEFQAAIALTQLSRLDEHNKVREANARYIEDSISDIKGLRPMYHNPNITFQTYYNFTLRYALPIGMMSIGMCLSGHKKMILYKCVLAKSIGKQRVTNMFLSGKKADGYPSAFL